MFLEHSDHYYTAHEERHSRSGTKKMMETSTDHLQNKQPSVLLILHESKLNAIINALIEQA